MGIISIDTNFCFECGAPKEEMHHVVPKSKGGKRTLPLCVDCHGKAHDTSHRRLMIDAAKEGRRKYVENGGKLGRKIGSIVNDDEMLLRHVDVIKELENKSSIRKIMKLTQKSSGTVQKVKKIWENKLHTNTLLRTD
jgi:phage FluMu protein gp41